MRSVRAAQPRLAIVLDSRVCSAAEKISSAPVANGAGPYSRGQHRWLRCLHLWFRTAARGSSAQQWPSKLVRFHVPQLMSPAKTSGPSALPLRPGKLVAAASVAVVRRRRSGRFSTESWSVLT